MKRNNLLLTFGLMRVVCMCLLFLVAQFILYSTNNTALAAEKKYQANSLKAANIIKPNEAASKQKEAKDYAPIASSVKNVTITYQLHPGQNFVALPFDNLNASDIVNIIENSGLDFQSVTVAYLDPINFMWKVYSRLYNSPNHQTADFPIDSTKGYQIQLNPKGEASLNFSITVFGQRDIDKHLIIKRFYNYISVPDSILNLSGNDNFCTVREFRQNIDPDNSANLVIRAQRNGEWKELHDLNIMKKEEAIFVKSDEEIDWDPSQTPLPNLPPIADNQNITTPEDTNKEIILAASDPNLEDTLSYVIVSNPVHGTLTGTSTNKIYTPVSNYCDQDSFTFKANDGEIDSNIATVTISVTPINDAPAINNLPITLIKDEGEDISLQIQATDVDNTDLAFEKTAGPGAVTPTGLFTYSDITEGTSEIIISVSDGLLTDQKKLTIIGTPIDEFGNPDNESSVYRESLESGINAAAAFQDRTTIQTNNTEHPSVGTYCIKAKVENSMEYHSGLIIYGFAPSGQSLNFDIYTPTTARLKIVFGQGNSYQGYPYGSQFIIKDFSAGFTQNVSIEIPENIRSTTTGVWFANYPPGGYEIYLDEISIGQLGPQAPVWVGPESITKEVGQTIEPTVLFTDDNLVDANMSPEIEGLAFLYTANQATLAGRANQQMNQAIEFTAIDADNLSTTHRIQLNITPPQPHPPVWLLPSNPYNYDVYLNSGIDRKIFDPQGLTMDITMDPHLQGMNVNGDGYLSWTPSQLGRYEVDFTASNSDGQTNGTIIFNIAEAPLRISKFPTVLTAGVVYRYLPREDDPEFPQARQQNQAERLWWLEHYDIILGHQDGWKNNMADLKILLAEHSGVTKPKFIAYQVYPICHIVRGHYLHRLERIEAFAAEKGYNIENFFLHYPSGQRVIDYPWDNDQVYILNIRSQEAKEYLRRECKEDTSYILPGTTDWTWDGMMGDTLAGPLAGQMKRLTNGDRVREYSGRTVQEIDASGDWVEDVATLLKVINNEENPHPDGMSSEKIIVPNSGNYTQWQNRGDAWIYDCGVAADGLFKEAWLSPFAALEPEIWDDIKAVTDEGKIFLNESQIATTMPSDYIPGNYNNNQDRKEIFLLADHLMCMQKDKVYYMPGWAGGIIGPMDMYWTEAAEGDLGKPKMAPGLNARELQYIDYPVKSVSKPGVTYNIYRRDFTEGGNPDGALKAVILIAPNAAWKYGNNRGVLELPFDNSTSYSYSLSELPTLPRGKNYYLLHADGTKTGPINNSVTIRHAEAVILVVN